MAPHSDAIDGYDHDRKHDSTGVELRFPSMAPTPMSPSAPHDVPCPEPPLQGTQTFTNTSNGAGVITPLQQQQVQRQSRGGRCQRWPPDGALQHFNGRNVICLSGRCVLGPPSRWKSSKVSSLLNLLLELTTALTSENFCQLENSVNLGNAHFNSVCSLLGGARRTSLDARLRCRYVGC